MDFRLGNWANVTFKKGRITETHTIDLDLITGIGELKQEETYKYTEFCI